jgi:hypothetical protein
MDDSILYTCNDTELRQLAERQGLPKLRRGIPRQTLIEIVAGLQDPRPEHFAGTTYTRQALQNLIVSQWAIVRSQLPGCTGQCLTYGCSDGRHLLCFEPNKDRVNK